MKQNNENNPFDLGTPTPKGYKVINANTQNKCKHEDMKLVGAIANSHLCHKCGGNLLSNEIEILNVPHEIGGFCDNEKCERFLILVV